MIFVLTRESGGNFPGACALSEADAAQVMKTKRVNRRKLMRRMIRLGRWGCHKLNVPGDYATTTVQELQRPNRRRFSLFPATAFAEMGEQRTRRLPQVAHALAARTASPRRRTFADVATPRVEIASRRTRRSFGWARRWQRLVHGAYSLPGSTARTASQ